MHFQSCKVDLLEVFGSDLTVVNAARVSMNKESTEMTPRDAGLVRYLAKHQHVTPFFHPQVRFRLRMPMWMARQWFKHTIGFARNEVSRRYVDEPPTFHVPVLRGRAPGKKQGSLDGPHADAEAHGETLRAACLAALDTYGSLLAAGVAPEQARMVLPVCTHTEFIETGSLAGYARLYNLRRSEDAQQEIREVALEVGAALAAAFPVSWASLTGGAGAGAGAAVPPAIPELEEGEVVSI